MFIIFYVLKLLRTFLQLSQPYWTGFEHFFVGAFFFVNYHAFAIDYDAMTPPRVAKVRSNNRICTN